MTDSVKLEKKWQKRWADAKLGEADLDDRPKFFMIFAYPGISGFLHVGHMRGFSYTDAICRFKRMQGYNVLFPVGTHASGNQAIAFAKKVQNKDQKWITYLKDNGCPEKLIPKLTNKDKIIEYFNTVYVEEYWKRFGFLCDWRRFTSTSFPDYERFIQWQFKKLRDKNLLVQKPYFATFCPQDGPVAVDPSETDISKGGKAEKNEYTLLKFKFDDLILVAATLRPETVYGQTNLWINPEGSYVKVKVDKETWVMSGAAAEKLAYQKDGTLIQDAIDPKDLIGKTAKAPQIDKDLPILPASFVDPHVGTGLVTCVPSDAPFDYIALKTLQDDEKLCKSHGIDHKMVKAVELIPIITSKGFKEFPAKEICEKNKITSLDQKEKLDEVTKEIYKAGFHTGVMKETCGPYKGKKVSEAKEIIRQDMLENGVADVFHDLSEEVVCRCGEKVVIKRIDDQWFIKYSDSALTASSKKHAETMHIYPDEFKNNATGVLDWFMDRACTRLGNWIGSKLPFDEKWIVEPISDSTLYPLFYIISRYTNEKLLNVEDLTEEFFDYVFLGKGNAKQVAEKINREKELIQQIRKDVTYFYPLDINLGGKEHQTVHFPVFIMNHVAILDKKLWPKGIFVNYWVTGKGGKISKSKGGAEPIPGAAEKYSVDGMRLYYAHIGSPHTDVVWDPDKAFTYRQAIEKIHLFIKEAIQKKEIKQDHLDKWIRSRISSAKQKASASFESLDLRDATTIIYFNILEDFRWYVRREGSNTGLVRELLKEWILMMTPITPHYAEECWELVGEKSLASAQDWPTIKKTDVDPWVEAGEDMLRSVINDIRTVTKLAKLEKAEQATIIISPTWKYDLYARLKKVMQTTRNVGEILKHVLEDEIIKKNAKEVNKIVVSCLKNPYRLPHEVTDQDHEFHVLDAAKKFLQEETDAKIIVVRAEKSKETKASSAGPGKPAIVVK